MNCVHTSESKCDSNPNRCKFKIILLWLELVQNQLERQQKNEMCIGLHWENAQKHLPFKTKKMVNIFERKPTQCIHELTQLYRIYGKTINLKAIYFVPTHSWRLCGEKKEKKFGIYCDSHLGLLKLRRIIKKQKNIVFAEASN